MPAFTYRYEVPLIILYNSYHAPVTVIVKMGNLISASIESSVPYNVSKVVLLYPRQKLKVEPGRLDEAQLEELEKLIEIRYIQSLSADSYTATVGNIQYTSANIVRTNVVGHTTSSYLRGPFYQSQLIQADDGASSYSPLRFGESMAMSEDGIVAIVGAPGRVYNSGGVYMFRRSGDTFTQTGVYVGSDTQIGDNFGTSVGMSYDASYFVSTAPHDSAAGNLYIFFNGGSGYIQLQQILEPNFTTPSRFGHSVVISRDGGTIIVSAPDKERNGVAVGAVYVYKYNFGLFGLVQVLYGDDAEPVQNLDMRFGDGLDYMDAYDMIIVGAPGFNNNQGRVYVYKWNGSSYGSVNVLNNSLPEYSDTQFGSNINAFEGELWIGSPYYQGDRGLYEHIPIQSDGTTGARMNFVGADGDYLGTYTSHAADIDINFVTAADGGGYVYAYQAFGTEEDEQYQLLQKIYPDILADGDQFGYSTVNSGDAVYNIIGSPGYDNSMGAIYVYIRD